MKVVKEIAFSQKGKYKIMLFLLIAFLLSVFFILFPLKLFGSFIFRNEKIILICGYFILLSSVFLTLQYIYLFFFSRIGLQISNEGIINNTSLLIPGLIKWNDIESIKICERYKNNIDVIIKTPDLYFKKTKNPFRKINMYVYYYFYNTPCVIGVQILDINAPELAKLLMDNLKEYG